VGEPLPKLQNMQMSRLMRDQLLLLPPCYFLQRNCLKSKHAKPKKHVINLSKCRDRKKLAPLFRQPAPSVYVRFTSSQKLSDLNRLSEIVLR